MPKVSIKLPAIQPTPVEKFKAGVVYHNASSGLESFWLGVIAGYGDNQLRLVSLSDGNRWSDNDPNENFQSVNASPFSILPKGTEITLKV